ncbi:hypothetical protein DUNSADRAFT_6704 [Dunaliella salina]|uniref:Guanine nucleotide-binding protein-like 1 n=1 Tax=Dunaliella salina TaxID=3046 RepID=A0ABQ7GMR7_DUNSA|nr:hypothetical protein DUNSADRAFT_6704 [Dunaliella salina]|eukprot:KAF5835891.1 hypothetical protein DUNSADRAFT_6704 [Dunaliella salina]
MTQEEKQFHKLSGKFRKKQLQEKRAQKREKRAEEAEEDEAAWAPVEDGGAEDGSQDSDTPAGSSKKEAKGRPKGKGKGKQQGGRGHEHETSSRAARREDGGSRQRPQHSAAGHASWADKTVDVAVRTQPIGYQPLAEVPLMHSLTQEHLHPGAPDSVNDAEPGQKNATLMPVCDPDEVGEVGEQHVVLGMPKRPKWQGVVSNAQELQELEERTFDEWQQHLAQEWGQVSFYEPRLDFWRQLWRALEFSDIVLHVVDARNPLLHFSAALAHHVLAEHKKKMVLCLNKCDLIPYAAVKLWTLYFERRCPGMRVVASSTTAGATQENAQESARAVMNAILDCSVNRGGESVQARKVVGADTEEVLQLSKQRNTPYKRGKVSQTARKALLQQQEQELEQRQQQLQPQHTYSSDEEEEDRRGTERGERGSSEAEEKTEANRRGSSSGHSSGSDAASDSNEGEGDDDGHFFSGQNGGEHGTGEQATHQLSTLVLAVVGEPNVGKSSTMNLLLGAHRVATSTHPGRTKRNQTHFMTPNLKLLDAPGLVFPRRGVSIPMQVLFGSLPIASCRDPYTVLSYLAARMWPRLHVVLGLHKVTEEGKPRPTGRATHEGRAEDEEWTPLELCEAYAAKKNWRGHHGRLDAFRAGNWILRAALQGHSGVVLAFLPPRDGVLSDPQHHGALRVDLSGPEGPCDGQ